MYKLSFEEFVKTNTLSIFNEIHGTSYSGWYYMYSDAGYAQCEIRFIPDTNEEDYEIYLKWHEIYNSPLAKALREE